MSLEGFKSWKAKEKTKIALKNLFLIAEFIS